MSAYYEQSSPVNATIFRLRVAITCLFSFAVIVAMAQPRAVRFVAPEPGYLVNREAQVLPEGVVALNAKPGDGMLVVKDLLSGKHIQYNMFPCPIIHGKH